MWYLPAAKIIEAFQPTLRAFRKKLRNKKRTVASLYTLPRILGGVKFFFVFIKNISYLILFTYTPLFSYD
jgi:hypothetical protein